MYIYLYIYTFSSLVTIELKTENKAQECKRPVDLSEKTGRRTKDEKISKRKKNHSK